MLAVGFPVSQFIAADGVKYATLFAIVCVVGDEPAPHDVQMPVVPGSEFVPDAR